MRKQLPMIVLAAALAGCATPSFNEVPPPAWQAPAPTVHVHPRGAGPMQSKLCRQVQCDSRDLAPTHPSPSPETR